MPVSEAASIRLRAVLLPSPTKASVKPWSSPFFSVMVSRSARAWQGCSQSERAFITGTAEYSASTSKVWWEKVRAATAST